jgi:hypothetical protein
MFAILKVRVINTSNEDQTKVLKTIEDLQSTQGIKRNQSIDAETL